MPVVQKWSDGLARLASARNHLGKILSRMGAVFSQR